MTRGKQVDYLTIGIIIGMHKAGKSYNAIVEESGISTATVGDIIRAFKNGVLKNQNREARSSKENKRLRPRLDIT